MGQARLKQYNRQQFLLHHPYCCYCGAPATTTDHCPPRSFFLGRQWPESYEFPACQGCNAQARRDEQVLGVLTRISVGEEKQGRAKDEWEKLVSGLKNNQPEIADEWLSMSRNDLRQSLRRAFGDKGDQLRHMGWGAIHVGPLTKAAIERFMVKLGKALYYRHLGVPLNGAVFVRHISSLVENATPEIFDSMLRIAPALATPSRANQPLTDQFIYRFNETSELGVIYAVVHFNEQMMFQIMAIRDDTFELLKARRAEAGQPMPSEGLHVSATMPPDPT